jgi:hypothetical protein
MHSQILKVSRNLCRELARGSNDQGARASARPIHQLMKDGEQEGSGLAAARDCAGQQITPG